MTTPLDVGDIAYAINTKVVNNDLIGVSINIVIITCITITKEGISYYVEDSECEWDSPIVHVYKNIDEAVAYFKTLKQNV